MTGIKKIEIHLDVLKTLAAHSYLKHKHACAIIKNGKICGIGINKHIQGKGIGISIHSEIDAMAGLKLLKGADLLVIRLSSNNKLRMSKPCSGCLRKIKTSGINNIYYSTNDQTIAVESAINMIPDHHCSSTRYRYSLK